MLLQPCCTAKHTIEELACHKSRHRPFEDQQPSSYRGARARASVAAPATKQLIAVATILVASAGTLRWQGSWNIGIPLNIWDINIINKNGIKRDCCSRIAAHFHLRFSLTDTWMCSVSHFLSPKASLVSASFLSLTHSYPYFLPRPLCTL